jgi:hypothetical protein
MAFATTRDYDLGVVLGRFKTDQGAVFEYMRRGDFGGDWASDFSHLVCVNDPIGWRYRFAKVLSTVAYVVTDETPDGSPIVERWAIKSHKRYS